ncbi:hypothetical protein BGW39_010718 [Mortierella sp. 14UC]|nr:hypothetical protein BGW39_010718 [Mortierella sp. 14UC]
MVYPSPPTFLPSSSCAASPSARSLSPSRLPHHQGSRRRNHAQESARDPLSTSVSGSSSLSHSGPLSPSASTLTSFSPYFPPPHSDNNNNHRQKQQPRQYQYPSNNNNSIHATLTDFPLAPPTLSNHLVVIPRRESSYGLNLQSSTFDQSAQSPISSSTLNSFDSRSPSSLNSGTAHQRYPISASAATSFELTPPHPSYIPSYSRPPVSRPDSIASFSAYSTHSNEPLHQQSKSGKSRNSLQKLYSLRKKSSANTMTTLSAKDGSSLIARAATNHLDLPEHRGMQTGSGFDNKTLVESVRGMTSVSLNASTLSKNPHLSRRTSESSITSTMTRKGNGGRWRKRWDDYRPRKYHPEDYKIKGFGLGALFSNERLYLHWIRFGVLQASIGVMLLSFGIGVAAWVGVGTLVLSLLTLIYATQLFHKRHLYMVTKRKEVKYFARTIPTLLTIGLFILYGANFGLSLYYGEDARSPPPWTKKDDTNFNSIF